MTSDTSVLRVFAGHCEAFIPAEPGWTPKQSHAVFGLRKPFTDEIASAFVPPLAGRSLAMTIRTTGANNGFPSPDLPLHSQAALW